MWGEGATAVVENANVHLKQAARSEWNWENIQNWIAQTGNRDDEISLISIELNDDSTKRELKQAKEMAKNVITKNPNCLAMISTFERQELERQEHL